MNPIMESCITPLNPMRRHVASAWIDNRLSGKNSNREAKA